jgi:putative outer membrane protein
MNNIIKKGIIFILAFVPTLICAQNKLYNQQTEIVLSEDELQLLLQKVAEAKLRKIRTEKLANLYKSQQKKAISDIYKSNEVKNFYYLAQDTDSTHTDVEQLNRKMDILLAYMMKKDSVSVIHLTDTVKYIANNTPNKDILLQKQLNAMSKSINDLSNQQKLLAAAIVPLATLNNKDKLNKMQQSIDSILLVSKKQAGHNNVQSHTETIIPVQSVRVPEYNNGNSVISEERRRTLEDLLAKYGHKKTPIYFANNSYNPLPHDTVAIDQIVTMLRENPELSILLEGYASNVGSSEYNNQLSMRRSESVARLLQKQGIALQRILTAFRGIDDSVDIEKARRVDISVIIR